MNMSIPIAEARGFERIGFKAALSLRGLPQVPLLHQTEVFSFAFLFFMMIIFRGDWRNCFLSSPSKTSLVCLRTILKAPFTSAWIKILEPLIL